jgi:MFS family permease
MATALLLRNRNYRLLFSAGALTNLGDGMVALALPWLATLVTRDPLAIAAVAAAGRLPWLLLSIPAGVVIDRSDRRRLIARADLLRAVIMGAICCSPLVRRGRGRSGCWQGWPFCSARPRCCATMRRKRSCPRWSRARNWGPPTARCGVSNN